MPQPQKPNLPPPTAEARPGYLATRLPGYHFAWLPGYLVTWLPSQQGVMFGLDARIALAVFAALAAVVGYVAFGRIDTARTAALIAELDAFENATASYTADMGTFMLFTLTNNTPETASPADIEALWQTGPIKPGFVRNWHGPYLHRETRKNTSYGVYSLTFATPQNFQQPCAEDTACAAWLSLTQVPADVWNRVNSYYDEANGTAKEDPSAKATSGRIQAEGAGDPRTLYFRLTPLPPSAPTP